MAGLGTIVSAVQTVLNTVSGIGTVYTYEPLLIAPDVYPYAVIHVQQTHEYRHGLGGAVGKKYVDYTVSARIHTVSHAPEDSVQGQAAFHTLLDAIRAAYRSNQSLGGATLRFGEDIQIAFDFPRSDGASVQYDALVTSVATEEING